MVKEFYLARQVNLLNDKNLNIKEFSSVNTDKEIFVCAFSLNAFVGITEIL